MESKLEPFQRLINALHEVDVLRSLGALLSWDQQIFLPPRGGDGRVEQSRLLARLEHQRFTAPELGDLLASLEDRRADLDDEHAALVRVTRRDYDRRRRLPERLVAEMAGAFAEGYDAWERARRESRFALFAPALARNICLQREVAAHFPEMDEPYDALLDGHEPGMTARHLAMMFGEYADAAHDLLSVGMSRRPPPASAPWKATRADLAAVVRRLVEALGFDFSAGRLDIATHPFTTQLGPHDVRLATWYREDDPLFTIRSILHEAGHGLYRQGFEARYLGTPLGTPVSAGGDEAQARLWENIVGRSLAFWEYFCAAFASLMPDGDSPHRVYDRLNHIVPGVHRVTADELTYNLHIVMRFEFERALLDGELAVDDLPEVWREKTKKSLGVEPTSDADGVLQDPHWSDGTFGYFPTYALGNFYAAQIYERLQTDIPAADAHIGRGEFAPLTEWLRGNVYCHGARYTAPELIERVSGRPPSGEALVRHLRARYFA